MGRRITIVINTTITITITTKTTITIAFSFTITCTMLIATITYNCSYLHWFEGVACSPAGAVIHLRVGKGVGWRWADPRAARERF